MVAREARHHNPKQEPLRLFAEPLSVSTTNLSYSPMGLLPFLEFQLKWKHGTAIHGC